MAISSGTWVKGQSGNPKGRPCDVYEIAKLARTYAPEAIETLVGLMRNEDVDAGSRVRAICALLDRGLGKPLERIEVLQENGGVSSRDLALWIVQSAAQGAGSTAGEPEPLPATEAPEQPPAALVPPPPQPQPDPVPVATSVPPTRCRPRTAGLVRLRCCSPAGHGVVRAAAWVRAERTNGELPRPA